MKLNSGELKALLEIVELGVIDQEDYLHSGNAILDYGDDWEEAKQYKVERFRLAADALDKIIGREETEAQRLRELADTLMDKEEVEQ